MSSRSILACGLFAAVAALSPSGAAPAGPARPNVLLLLCDDLNTALGCYGERRARTPNLDRLASQGTRFTQAFAPWASCMPSRYSFLSGWSPVRTGVHDFSPHGRDGALREAVYLPEHFKALGYVTGRLDKVFHIGRDVPDVWDVTEEPMRTLADGSRTTVWTGIEVETLGLERSVIRADRDDRVVGEKGVTQIMDDALGDEALFDGRTARRARELLERFSGEGRPFFLAVGFRRPHLPWVAQKRFFEPFPYDAFADGPVEPGTEAALPDEARARLRAHYQAALHSVDHHLGTVLARLDELGVAGNTIVAVFGDHGYLLGERGTLYGKGVLWDEALRTALILRVPDSRAPAVVDLPVGLVDLYPTLVELARRPEFRRPLPGPADGASRTGLLLRHGAHATGRTPL
jgi:iduronate 2-sulfatase